MIKIIKYFWTFKEKLNWLKFKRDEMVKIIKYLRPIRKN